MGLLGLLCALIWFSGCGDKATGGDAAKPAEKLPYDAGVEGLPDAVPTSTLEAKDGDTVRLSVSYVAKRIAGRKVRMLAYNRSVPGPTLRVPQGAAITLILQNETDLPTSLHSHGVRLDYRNDGVPGVTQDPTGRGQAFAYHIRFPDAGIFWYHPHYREDYQMELGLYGSYLVTAKDSSYWPPVHREVVLMLDDVALRGNVIQPFYSNLPDHSLMGRFGNVFMVNGDTAFTMHVKRNETIRFYVVNASNSRVYNLQYSRDMDLNILGADNGRFEFPSSRENYLVAPSERAIFQLWFNDGKDDYDTLDLLNATGFGDAVLGHFVYDPDTARPDLSGSMTLKQSPQVAASIDPFRASFDKSPDEEILLTGYMDMSVPLAKAAAAGALGKEAAAQHDPDPGNRMGVEWSDSVHGPAMLAMNDLANARNMHWAIRDLKTGKENHEIDWTFKRGAKVLIRVHNDTTVASADPKIMNHPMPHPLHFHGQRFLVVRENGKAPLEGLAWRDSYLIGRGFTVDLLLDADNPGEWMFHCHIAEHLENDMMGHFRVLDSVTGEKPAFEWTLSLKLATALDSLRRDTVLATELPALITGAVNARAVSGTATVAAVLDGKLYILAAGAAAPVTADLDPQGAFSFPSALLGSAASGQARFFVKSAAYRPAPDTLRLTLDRRGKFSWSLDLDLAGDTAFTALRGEANAVTHMQGEVSGKVNGYDATVLRDTLYFRNMIYPELFANAPLAADGGFRFDAADIVGSLDGLHDVKIFLKPLAGQRQFDPDTVRVHISIP